MFRRVFPEKRRALENPGLRMTSLLLSVFLLTLSTGGHAEDPYLDAIQHEAEKLDDTAVEGGVEAKSQSDAAADEPLAQFEQELESRYRGTYLFYKKLPAKSQEEVLLEHQQGASIEDVRKTIMNRYLHSR